MKMQYVIVIAMALLSHCAFGMQALLQKQKKMADDLLALAWLKTGEGQITTKLVAKGPQPLIIIFDPDKIEGQGKKKAMELKLETAINDSVAPIITTYNLYARVSPSALINWHKGATSDNALVVLIPDIPPYNEYMNMYYKQTEKDRATTDLLLGIKYSTLSNIYRPATWQTKPAESTDPAYDLGSYLKEILITHDDLKKKNCENCFITWDIYLSGHGSQAITDRKGNITPGYIADIPVPFFKKLLHFLNTRITTRSLVYDTCFGGGEHLIMPYQYKALTVAEEDQEKKFLKKQEDNVDEILKFMVISATTFEKVTYTEGKTEASISFEKYFKDLNLYFKDPKSIFLAQAIDHVSEWSKSYHLEYPFWLQLPAVRFPNTNRFVIPESDTMFILDDVKVKRAQASKSQEIKIPATVKIIFLMTSNIPIKLTLEGNSMPFLIPYNMQEAQYYFKEIYAPHIYLIAGKTTSGTQDNPRTDVVTMRNGLSKKISILSKTKTGSIEVAYFNINKFTINLDDDHDVSEQEKEYGWIPFTRKAISSDPANIQGPLTFENISISTGSGGITIDSASNPKLDILQKIDPFTAPRFEKWISIATFSKESKERERLKMLFNQYLSLNNNPIMIKDWKQKISEEDKKWIEGMTAPMQDAYEKWRDNKYSDFSGERGWADSLRNLLDQKRREELVKQYVFKDPKALEAWKNNLSSDDKTWLDNITNPNENAFTIWKNENYPDGSKQRQWLEKLLKDYPMLRPQVKSGGA